MNYERDNHVFIFYFIFYDVRVEVNIFASIMKLADLIKIRRKGMVKPYGTDF